MNRIAEYIESGVLELYVMGATSAEEYEEVERMAAQHAEVRQEILRIREAIEAFALAHAVYPKAAVKPLVLAAIAYLERVKQGEPSSVPPLLHQNSRVEDYAEWLSHWDKDVPSDFEEVYVKLIGATPEATTAIVWLKEMPYFEVHEKEYERFLIVEGNCEVIVEAETFSLAPGDFFAVPLHARHTVNVTSKVPCKAILQRSPV